MQQLPYELLQLISGNLLPRYQCRFAIVNKFHYKYLYTPLLKWHAKRALIPIPQHKWSMQNSYISLIQIDKYLAIYETYDSEYLRVHNPIHRYVNILYYSEENGIHTHLSQHMCKSNMAFLCSIIKDTEMLNGCYKYIHRKFIWMYINSRHKLMSMSEEIIDNILKYLHFVDVENFLRSNIYIEGIHP